MPRGIRACCHHNTTYTEEITLSPIQNVLPIQNVDEYCLSKPELLWRQFQLLQQYKLLPQQSQLSP